MPWEIVQFLLIGTKIYDLVALNKIQQYHGPKQALTSSPNETPVNVSVLSVMRDTWSPWCPTETLDQWHWVVKAVGQFFPPGWVAGGEERESELLEQGGPLPRPLFDYQASKRLSFTHSFLHFLFHIHKG